MPLSFPKPNEPAPVSEIVKTLASGTKVKLRIPRMRACNELNAKGKLCQGHLKRWHEFTSEVAARGSEVYRCERCHTIYLPNPQEAPRTGVLSW
jgi:hypothetical protein